MVKGLYTAYTGMLNEQHRMDTITNNLANFSTTGFKKEGATAQSFKDVLGVKIKDTSEWNIPRRLGTLNMGVKIGENYTDYSEGSFKETGNTWDFAIAGNGFFAIEFTNKAGETSVKYTRDGSFTLNQAGDLVTKDGDFVLDQAGNHINIDPLAVVSTASNGGIYVNGELAATIGLTDFEDYNYLEKYGENMYAPVEGATQIPATGKFVGGYLEQSNVEMVSEMVEMISIQRQYEANQKVVQTMDESLDSAVNKLGMLG